MLQQPTPRDFVIATGKLSSLADFVASAFSTVGLDWRAYVEIDASLKRPTELLGFAGDAALAHHDLGWIARTVIPEVSVAMVRAEPSTREQTGTRSMTLHGRRD
jgi:GDPmannose 4,6-dehydratase